MICSNCSKEIPDGRLFCGFCGTRLSPAEETTQPEATPTQTDPGAREPALRAVDQDAVTRIDRAETPTQVMEEAQPAQGVEEQMCPQCGWHNPRDGRFCLKCGSLLEKPAEKKASAQPARAASPKTPAAVKRAKAIEKPLRQREEQKPLEPKPIPAWTVLLGALGGIIGGFLGYYAQDPRYITNLGTWWAIYGLCSSLALFIILLVYGWLRWWHLLAGTAASALLWNGLYHFGMGVLGSFTWELPSILLEGALPGLLGLLLGTALFRGTRRWNQTLLLGLLWLAAGWTGFFTIASSTLSSWLQPVYILKRSFQLSLILGYGLVSLLMAGGLVWLLNCSLAGKTGQRAPQPKQMWASLGLTAFGWFLAEAVITTMYATGSMYFVWPFAVMGLIGGLFTLLALRQIRQMDLKWAAAAVLVWVLMSMLRVWSGTEWAWDVLGASSWFVVSFFTFALAAAGTSILIDPRRPDWQLAAWTALYWGSAVALSVSTANYLNDLSGVRMFFFAAGIRFDAWLWVTPLYMLAAMYFTTHLLQKRAVVPHPLPELSDEPE